MFLKVSRWDQRFYLPLIGIMSLPYAADCIERLFPLQPVIVTVKTNAAFQATARRAFDSIVFYEEVKHRVPFLLRLALPRPVRSEGKKTAGGDIVRCVYEHGWLSKRITRLEDAKLLAFEVIEQKLHFERDVRLLDGSFEVEGAKGAGSEAASVVLTTRYRALLHPRWFWEPIEREVVHTLHRHVLEGMRREAEGAAQEPAQDPAELSSADRR